MKQQASQYLRAILETPITRGIQGQSTEDMERLLSQIQCKRRQQEAFFNAMKERNKIIPLIRQQIGPMVRGKPAHRVNMYAFRNVDQFNEEHFRRRQVSKKSSLRALQFKDDSNTQLWSLPSIGNQRKICKEFAKNQVCLDSNCRRLHVWNPNSDFKMPSGDPSLCYYNLIAKKDQCQRRIRPRISSCA